MGQTVYIVAISIIAAVVVGSTVFFVWTLLERPSRSAPAAKETGAVSGDEQERLQRTDEGDR